MFNFLLRFKTQNSKFKYAGIFDAETNILLLIGRNFTAINYLKEWFKDVYAFDIPINNKTQELFQDQLANSSEGMFFNWDSKIQNFKLNNDTSDFLKTKSKLLNEKYKYLCNMIQFIESQRLPNRKNIAYQEFIYINKRIEALRYQDKNFPENEILDFPYLLQYAEIKGINYKQAAQEILFKSKMVDGILIKSEGLKLRYFSLLKDVGDLEEVKKVYNDFLLEYNRVE